MVNAPAWLTARPIAHRGLHDGVMGVRENTLTAAARAVARGFAVECDVQISADGEAIVFHDFTLERLTGETGRVDRRSAAALCALGVGGTADRIPTLAALLDRIDAKVPLIVEIKSAFDGNLRLAERTAAVVADYSGPLALKSFDPAIVAALRRLRPDRPRGIVAEGRYVHEDWAGLSPDAKDALANLLHWPETQPDFVSWHVGDLPHAAPFLARHLGSRPVMTWTVRDEPARRRATEHADQIVFEGFDPD